jgi:hypothetical protein
MLVHSEAASPNILAGHWPQVFVACVMIEPFSERFPTESVIEFTNLLLYISSILQRTPPKFLFAPILLAHIEV